jgi:hypothetical protein
MSRKGSWKGTPGKISSLGAKTIPPIHNPLKLSFRKIASYCTGGIPLILFVLFCSVFDPVFGADTRVIEAEEVIIHFPETLRNAAERLAAVYPRLKAELETTLQWKLDSKPTIFLTKDSKAFQKIVGSSVIAAYALPRRNLIVIDYSKMRIPPFSMEATVKHELCHLLLHYHIRGGLLPKWLDEGVAQWVSDGIAEIIIDRKRSVLSEAVLTKRTIPIRFLADSFPDDKELLVLAYEESKSFVEYIRDNYGAGGILNILNALKDGYTINEAVPKALSISFIELEQKWLNYIKRRGGWFRYLSRNLYEILFLFAALVTILGFIKYLLKKRAYREEWEDDV